MAIHYKKIEDTLQNTLVMAQSTAEEVKEVARQQAEQIIKQFIWILQAVLNAAGRIQILFCYQQYLLLPLTKQRWITTDLQNFLK